MAVSIDWASTITSCTTALRVPEIVFAADQFGAPHAAQVVGSPKNPRMRTKGPFRPHFSLKHCAGSRSCRLPQYRHMKKLPSGFPISSSSVCSESVRYQMFSSDSLSSRSGSTRTGTYPSPRSLLAARESPAAMRK